MHFEIYESSGTPVIFRSFANKSIVSRSWGLLGLLGGSWSLLGRSLGALGAFLADLATLLAVSWDALEPS